MDKGQSESSNPSAVSASRTAPAIAPRTCPGTHSPAASCFLYFHGGLLASGLCWENSQPLMHFLHTTHWQDHWSYWTTKQPENWNTVSLSLVPCLLHSGTISHTTALHVTLPHAAYDNQPYNPITNHGYLPHMLLSIVWPSYSKNTHSIIPPSIHPLQTYSCRIQMPLSLRSFLFLYVFRFLLLYPFVHYWVTAGCPEYRKANIVTLVFAKKEELACEVDQKMGAKLRDASSTRW